MNKRAIISTLIFFTFLARLPAAEVPNFDAESALDFLVAQTDLGPRNPGSDAHYLAKDFFVKTLRQYTDSVRQQQFTHQSTTANATFELTNVIAHLGPNTGKQIILGAHWDSRPWADQDPDYSKRNQPIIGANDGASGVAVLLEMARIFAKSPPPIGVTIVLFDGEDLGTSQVLSEFAVGSKYYAHHLKNPERYRFAVVLDMIGDANLQIPMEGNSIRSAPEVTHRIWHIADSLGYSAFQPRIGTDVYDDHLMLIRYAGVPGVDLIDFQYPDQTNRFWHTSQDTPNKCSPRSLHAVGDVLLHLIYQSDQK